MVGVGRGVQLGGWVMDGGVCNGGWSDSRWGCWGNLGKNKADVGAVTRRGGGVPFARPAGLLSWWVRCPPCPLSWRRLTPSSLPLVESTDPQRRECNRSD